MRNTYDLNTVVPIPDDAHVCSDHRVYIVTERRYYPDLKYNMDRRMWIGKAVSDTHMHPSNTYKYNFPDKLSDITHLNLPVYHKKIGMYAVALSIGKSTGIYDDLVTYLGPENANLVMDYAVYSIITKSNAAKNFSEEMTGRMQFLKQTYSDSWIHDKISTDITDDHVQAFKNAWLKRFSADILKNVWVCVDGSNNDCRANIVEAEKGNAKSHKNIDIISFMYAVTEDGTPVYSQVYRGGREDSKAVVSMVEQLKGYSVTPKGLDLDRGFCDENTIRHLKDNGFQYVIKLKENTAGFQILLQKYSSDLRFNWDYALGHSLYGTGESVKVFKTGDLNEYCVLIWDAKNGGMRTDYLVDGVLDTIHDAQESISAGNLPVIPAKYSSYIKVNDTDGTYSIEVNRQLLQKDMNEKGYNGLICSERMAASEAARIYGLRDSCEKQYAILKTQLGGNTFRAHTMHGITVREMIAFTASVIRNEIMKVCMAAKPRLDTNKVIKELDLISMDLQPDGDYKVYAHLGRKQKEILSLFNVRTEDLDYIASFENRRIHGDMYSPIQSLKQEEYSDNSSSTVRIKGIPVGSKAVGKYAKTPEKKPVGKKRGRPKKEEVKRGPGRPAGSKNKPKNPDEADKPKRGRGRPKGSKNKPKS